MENNQKARRMKLPGTFVLAQEMVQWVLSTQAMSDGFRITLWNLDSPFMTNASMEREVTISGRVLFRGGENAFSGKAFLKKIEGRWHPANLDLEIVGETKFSLELDFDEDLVGFVVK